MSLERLAERFGFFPCDANKAPNVALCGDHNRFRNGVRPTSEECAAWIGRPIGLWAGDNGIGVIDVDADGYFADYIQSVEDAGLSDVLARCAIAETPGGHHIYCLVPGLTDGNEKLAMFAEPQYDINRDKETSVIIETRGVGGYVIIPPSPGYRFEQSSLLAIEPITLDDWNELKAVARIFDQRSVPVVEAPKSSRPSYGKRPGDDYNDREGVTALIEAAGWRRFGRSAKGRISFTRPGKDRGVSATVTSDDKCLYIFSSSTVFEQFKAYSPFSVYTILNHSGDWAAAAKTLAAEGYGERTPARTPEEWSVDASGNEIPTIQTNGVPLDIVVGECIGALALYNAQQQPRLFARSGQMVEIVRDEDGRASIRAIDEDRLRFILSRAARFVSIGAKGNASIVYPPPAVVKSLLVIGDLDFLPPLASVAQAPFLSASGLVLAAGYDKGSRQYLVADTDWKIAQKSGRDAARWLLSEVLTDFPFQAQADMANALALMVLPFVRPSVDGPTPLHLIDAPVQGSGKSLLGKVCAIPATGREAAALNAPTQEEEWEKVILSSLAAGRPIVMVDNIARRVDSASFAGALTAVDFEGRLLGSNRMGVYPVRCVWIGSSNNAQLSTDIVRRTVSIRLDPRMERPWTREGFKRENIIAWVKANRREIVANILAMVNAWVLAGRPSWTGNLHGSYEEYSRILGGILDVCGIDGFLQNFEVMWESANSEETSWAGFYERWWTRFGGDEVKASDLVDIFSEDENLVGLLGNYNEQSQKIRLGSQLKKRVGRISGRFLVKIARNTHKVFRFKLVLSEERPTQDPHQDSGSKDGSCGSCGSSTSSAHEKNISVQTGADIENTYIETGETHPPDPQTPSPKDRGQTEELSGSALRDAVEAEAAREQERLALEKLFGIGGDDAQ